MSQIINQYSALWMAVVLLLVLTAILFRHKPQPGEYLAFGGLIVGLAVAWTLLHPIQTPLMEDTQKVQAMIGQGKPVLLEFQSPY